MAVANGTFTRTNSFASEAERIIPRFFVDCVEDVVASEREKRLISREEERVELIMPGNAYNKPVERVTDAHRQRWPKEYEAFKAGIEMATDGVPLEMWPVLRPGMVKELKFLGFRTVEDLAKMGDLECQRIGMGGQSIRSLARAFIDDAERSRLTSELEARNGQMSNQIAELTAKVEQLSTLLSQTHSQLQDQRNAPHPLATAIPGMNDPVEQARQEVPQARGTSSLDALASIPKRGPGRPPKNPVVQPA